MTPDQIQLAVLCGALGGFAGSQLLGFNPIRALICSASGAVMGLFISFGILMWVLVR